jgi:hypothetical protein
MRRPARPLTVVCAALALTLPAIPTSGASQELPFRVTIVEWDRELLKRQRDAYRSEAAEREVLFCVESWTTGARANGIERVVITRVRRELAGQKHHIDDMGAPCVASDGKPLPMFHTHSEGNCQFSPSDLIVLVVRAAAFEGVQCGERHFIWAFRWQVVAMATTVELAGGITGALPPDAATPSNVPGPHKGPRGVTTTPACDRRWETRRTCGPQSVDRW